MELLLHLGALEAPNFDITPLGRRMAELPLEPMYSKTIILSEVCYNKYYHLFFFEDVHLRNDILFLVM